MDLLEKLKAGTRAKKEVLWPGTNEVVSLRVLSDDDYLKATLAADEIFKSVTLANAGRYNAEIETQLLFKAISVPLTGKSLGTITDFRTILIPEVKSILSDELSALHDEYSPDPMQLSDTEFDVLFDNVKKNVEETTGNISNIFVARKLIKSLVAQLKS